MKAPSRITRVFLLIALIAAGGVIWCAWQYWTMKGKIAPTGGLYFFQRVELPVPQFLQDDERWREDHLGATPGTLGSEGCAVASAAMVLSYYGVDIDPQRLNAVLKDNGGYTEQGWIYWEKAAEIAPDRVRFVYEDKPSYQLIDWNLWRRNPVIVRLRYPSGITHFVVICGKRGFDYLIRDPGLGSVKGIYPLHEFGSEIEALRYYEPIATQ